MTPENIVAFLCFLGAGFGFGFMLGRWQEKQIVRRIIQDLLDERRAWREQP